MDPYVGEIRLFAGDYPPHGWAFCDGSLLSITKYSTLYSLLATNFGGDGNSNFALPDLRDRVPVGAGQGPGLTMRTQGEMGGVATVVLQNAHLSAHSHPIVASTGPASTATPGQGVGLATPTDPLVQPYSHNTDATGSFAAYADATVQPVGGGQPHSNLMPSVGLNFIIALEGIYPSP
jgi:microcystin-dependent protein